MSTPLESIRKYCTACVGSPHDVRNCCGDQCKNGGCNSKGVCLFYRYRLGTGRPSVKLIRKNCLWCQGESKKFVTECGSRDCLLWYYRLGKNPAFSEETRRKRQERARSQKLGRESQHDDGVPGGLSAVR